MTQENTYDHETWLERIDAESDEDVFQRIHGKPLKDFSPQILNTRLSLELKLNKKSEAVIEINIALNVYESEREEDLRDDQGNQARDLLNNLATRLNEAAQTLNDVENNRYALSAIIGALPLHTDIFTTISEDEQITQFNEVADGVRKLALFATKVAHTPTFSNGLPRIGAGRREDHHIDALLIRLESIITRSRNNHVQHKKPPSVYKCIEEILDLCEIPLGAQHSEDRVGRSAKTIQNRIIEIKKRGSPYLPKPSRK